PLRGKSTSSSTESPRLPHRVVMERRPGSDEHQLVRGAAGARPSSQQRYAVRTRGGCSYKAATPERGELIESDRGPWARRSQAACTPGCSAPALRQPESVQPWEGRAPARPPLTPQPTPTTAESPPLPAPPPQTPVTAPEARARPTGTQACSP